MARATRREFLKTTAAASTAWWVSNSLAPQISRAANEQLNIACIGVGGKGSSDTDQAAAFGKIVALCDIDDGPLSAKAQKFPEAKTFHDYREMFAALGPQIDAVTVSTPDHSHAPASVMAMKLGKHVYCQKPLTHTVYEARRMRELAVEKKLVTQMGNQGTAEHGLRRAVEMIQDGVLGGVTEVHVWTNRPVWPQAPDVVARPPKEEIPANVHWDLFLGPAPERPYSKAYHPFKWRGWWDFGTGALGDMACHTGNMAFMALQLGYPTSVVAEAEDINPETFPAWARITWEFPARGKMPPVKFVWYEGKRNGQKLLPPAELAHGEKFSDSGLLLIGEKGTLFSPNDYGAAYVLLPAKEFEGYKGPPETLARNGGGDAGMKKEWTDGIHGGPAPFANFGYAGLFTEAMLLGNVALRAGPGKKLLWDGPSMKVTNYGEANQYLHMEYRPGWSL